MLASGCSCSVIPARLAAGQAKAGI